jgi:2-amino-4-hydroxy-6-hydroxymethyldihydropteridine diphosphokinase
MILIGLGSNVEGPWGTPEETVRAALSELARGKTRLVEASSLMRSKPMGPVEQPDFVNAVAMVTTKLDPEHLMRHLHDLELAADRRRSVRWGPRTLDLDLLDYDGRVMTGEGAARGHQKPLILPHPGIAEREFVLAPLHQIAPEWTHPVTGLSATQMLAALGLEDQSFDFIE